MTKRYKRERIEVCEEAGHPVTFWWRKGEHTIVEIVDRWVLKTYGGKKKPNGHTTKLSPLGSEYIACIRMVKLGI